MKSFKFSLQALLTLREQQEQTALHEYGRALVARERAVSDLSAVEDELASAWMHLSEQLNSDCPAAELTRLHAFAQAVEERRLEREKAAKATRIEAHTAFMHLLSARQARTVLEEYLAKEKKRYERAKRRREQKGQDDLPLSRSGLAALLQLSRPTLWN